MKFKFINNFEVALAAPLAADALAVSLYLAGGVAAMADASPELVYPLTLVEINETTKEEVRSEIVYVVGANEPEGYVTVERAKEGTDLQSWSANSVTFASNRETAATIGHKYTYTDEAVAEAGGGGGEGGGAFSIGIVDVETQGSAVAYEVEAGSVLIPNSIEMVLAGDTTPALPVMADAAFPYVFDGGQEAALWTPDGKYLITTNNWGTTDKTVLVFDRDDLTTPIPNGPDMELNVETLGQSRNGSYLVVGHWGDPSNTIFGRDPLTIAGDMLPELSIGAANDATFSHDDAFIAVAHATSPFLTVVNTATQVVVADTPVPDFTAYSVAFNHDSSLLAVGHGGGNNLTVVDTSTWTAVADTPSIAGAVHDVAFNADGTRLVLAHEGSPFFTVLDTSDWSVVTGTPTLAGIGRALNFNNDFTQLAVGHSSGDGLTVVNPTDWSVVAGTPGLGGTVWTVDYSHDGTLLSVGAFGNIVRVFAVVDWSVVADLSTDALPRTVKFGAGDDEFYVSEGSNLHVFDTATWELKGYSASIPSGLYYDMALTSDGTQAVVATSGPDRAIVYNLTPWGKITTVGAEYEYGRVDSTPDERYLAIGAIGMDEVVILDTQNGFEKAAGTEGVVTTGGTNNFRGALAFNPDGTRLALNSDRSDLYVYSVGDWEQVHFGTTLHSGDVHDMKYTPDGEFLLLGKSSTTTDHGTELLVAAGDSYAYSSEQFSLVVGGGRSYNLDISADGRYMVSVGGNTTSNRGTYLYSFATKELVDSKMEGRYPRTVMFDPLGEGILATGNNTNTLYLYDTSNLKLPTVRLGDTAGGDNVAADTPLAYDGAWGGVELTPQMRGLENLHVTVSGAAAGWGQWHAVVHGYKLETPQQ